MSKFHAINCISNGMVFDTEVKAIETKRKLREQKTPYRYRNFFNKDDAEHFAKTGMTRSEAAENTLEKYLEFADEYQNPNTPIVFTDGACSRGKKSYAGAGVYWGENDERNEKIRVDGDQTNQRAELTAIKRAVEQADELKIRTLHIKTDSEYCIRMIENIEKIERRGWNGKNGKSVPNKDLLKEIRKKTRNNKIIMSHVKAHTGILGNKRADALAVAARKEKEIEDEEAEKSRKRKTTCPSPESCSREKQARNECENHEKHAH